MEILGDLHEWACLTLQEWEIPYYTERILDWLIPAFPNPRYINWALQLEAIQETKNTFVKHYAPSDNKVPKKVQNIDVCKTLMPPLPQQIKNRLDLWPEYQ